MKDKNVVDYTKISLDEWLNLIYSSQDEDLLLNYMFPNEVVRDEYLKTIHNRSDEEVINLLRKFLIPSGSLGKDEFSMINLIFSMKNDKERFYKLMKMEYYKRLVKSCFNVNNYSVWEGNTWIIDLLPQNPKLAIDALYAYFIAHIQLLPDGRFRGIQDAMALIRGKFIDISHPSSLLLELDPYKFEHLIEALYNEMGYDTILTKRTHDGGVDINAEKNNVGEREKLLIQCKRQKKNVKVEEVRTLLGVVSSEKATKGVLVTTSEFTVPSKNFVNENPRLEIIGKKDLHKLLNEFLGSNWPTHLDFFISQSISRVKKRLL